MDVTTKCPKCGLLLALDTTDGDEFECPQCGQRLTIQSTAAKAKPTKRPPPRRTATSGAPPASHMDDIDWSIPEIPQQILRRKRRSVDLDPAVIWSILIVSACVLALIVGGVYFASRGNSFAGLGRDARSTMIAFAPDDWETQSFMRYGAAQRHPHRNSFLLANLVPASAKLISTDDLDEVMICDGVGRAFVLTSVRDLPPLEEFRKRGGAAETYRGNEVLRIGGQSFARVSDRAIAMAENDAVMRRMVDASQGSSAAPPDLPNDYTALFRIRTRAVKLRTAIPTWMTAFDNIGVSIRLNNDGSATLFLFGEATSEAAAKESVPQIERVHLNFREQLESVRTLYRGAISDLEKLSSAIAGNQVVQEGKRVGVRCVVSAELFPALAQAQFGASASPPTVTPTPQPTPPPVVSSPPTQRPDPSKPAIPPFFGPVADHAQQTQDNLSAQFGRQRTVMIVASGFAQGAEQKKLADDLTELVKKIDVGNNAVNYNTIQSGSWVACVFAPIDDIDGFARRIEFATVAQVSTEQRRIYLTPKK